MIKEMKTNEELTKLFRNNFELAMYAIEIGRRLVRAGKEFSLTNLLREVKNNPLKGDLEELIIAHREEEAARALEEENEAN